MMPIRVGWLHNNPNGSVRHQASHQLVLVWMHSMEITMRTTVTVDDQLMARAQELTGTRERSALIRQALEALVARESARRLSRLGGSDPDADAAPRSRKPVSRRTSRGTRAS